MHPKTMSTCLDLSASSLGARQLCLDLGARQLSLLSQNARHQNLGLSARILSLGWSAKHLCQCLGARYLKLVLRVRHPCLGLSTRQLEVGLGARHLCLSARQLRVGLTCSLMSKQPASFFQWMQKPSSNVAGSSSISSVLQFLYDKYKKDMTSATPMYIPSPSLSRTSSQLFPAGLPTFNLINYLKGDQSKVTSFQDIRSLKEWQKENVSCNWQKKTTKG